MKFHALGYTALLCTLVSCAVVPERKFYLDPAPLDTVDAYKYDMNAYMSKYGEHDGVYLKLENLVEHTRNDVDWIAYQTSALSYMVLNPDAEWLTTMTIPVESDQELLSAFINIISPDGTVRTYSKEDMKVEVAGDGDMVYRFAYPDIEAGTVVDEGYDIKYRHGSDLLRDVMPLQYGLPCEQMSVQYAFPKEFWVSIKRINDGDNPYPPGLKADKESFEKVNIISYEATDVAPIEDEPYSPYEKEFSNYLDLAITGANTMALIKSWHEYASDYRKYALHRESMWKDRARDVLKEIVNDDMSDFEKMEAIVTWLQTELRVEGVPEDFNFNDMIEQKKGSPMLITGLGQLMLDKEEIDADFLLAYSAEDGYFDESYLTAGIIHIPALHVNLEEKDYVLIPYQKHYPVDLVPEQIQGQRALRINADGFNGWVQLPYGNVARNTITESYDLQIDEEGMITVTEEKELRGSVAYTVRRLLEEVTEKEEQEVMENLLTYEEGDVNLEEYEIRNRDTYDKPLQISLSYTIDNLVTVTPEEVIFQTGGLLSPSSRGKTKVDAKKRANPIRIYHDERLVRNITISHPDSWELATLPENSSHSNDFGEVSAEYHTTAGKVEMTLSRTLNQVNRSAKEYTQLLDIVGSQTRYLHVPTLIFSVSGG